MSTRFQYLAASLVGPLAVGQNLTVLSINPSYWLLYLCSGAGAQRELVCCN